MIFETDSYLPDVEAVMLDMVHADPEEPSGLISRQHLETGGKRLRARLALAATQSLGGDPVKSVAWAAACELLHNATLVHDDLQDGDRTRRGKPAAWVTHGMAQAINAGDLMWVCPYLAIQHVDVQDSLKWHLCQLLANRAAMVVRGQATEMSLAAEDNTGLSSYLRAIEGKTSALFELPVHGAALVAGRGLEGAQTISAPFGTVGMLFQMQDDVLDLFGDKGRDEIGADLREGKISALVVEHLRLHPEDSEGLLELLSLPRDGTPTDRIEETISAFRDGGALLGVCNRIRGMADDATGSSCLEAEPALRDLLGRMVDLILTPISHVLD